MIQVPFVYTSSFQTMATADNCSDIAMITEEFKNVSVSGKRKPNPKTNPNSPSAEKTMANHKLDNKLDVSAKTFMDDRVKQYQNIQMQMIRDIGRVVERIAPPTSEPDWFNWIISSGSHQVLTSAFSALPRADIVVRKTSGCGPEAQPLWCWFVQLEASKVICQLLELAFIKRPEFIESLVTQTGIMLQLKLHLKHFFGATKPLSNNENTLVAQWLRIARFALPKALSSNDHGVSTLLLENLRVSKPWATDKHILLMIDAVSASCTF